jgi:hypothetical protein
VIGRVHRGEQPYFRGFAPWGTVFRRGLHAFVAIATYLSPAAAFAAGAWFASSNGATSSATVLALSGGALFVLGVYVLPGGMTYNAAFGDMSYLYRPDKALRRALSGGRRYLWAWLIALSAVTLSLVGLLVLGVGFFYTSVWAWGVTGYAFSKALVLVGGADSNEHGPK